MSLTESGLLAKHNANIARLAQSFGINLPAEGDGSQDAAEGNKVSSLIDQTKNIGLFDEPKFKQKLYDLVDNDPKVAPKVDSSSTSQL